MSPRTRRPGNQATPQEGPTMTEQATATPEQANATPEQTPAAESNGKQRTTAPLQLTVPLDLKAKIKAAADEAGKTEARFVLENFTTYKFPDYTLPEQARTGHGGTRQKALFPKSLSKEEKSKRQDNARELLAMLDTKYGGNLDALKAQLGLT